jgi:hypothetical protein
MAAAGALAVLVVDEPLGQLAGIILILTAVLLWFFRR